MNPNDKERDCLFTTIEKHSPFLGVFVRRKKVKNGKSMYYLYTKDEENLIMCATDVGSYAYEISRNAKFISKSDPYYCGSLNGSKSNLTYQGIDFNGKQHISVRYKKSNEKEVVFRQFSATIPPDIQLLQREPQLVNGTWLLRFPSLDGISSEKNFMMDHGDDYCIAFEKIADEEYYFALRNPLSIFQGFCLALSIMKRFSHE